MSAEGSNRLIFDAELKAAQAFWIAQLPRGARGPGLPLDFKRSRVYSPRHESVTVELPEESQQRLFRLTGGRPLLTYTALLATLAVTLRRYTTADTIIVGSPAVKIAGEPEADGNVLAIVMELSEQVPFRDLLEQLHKGLVAAYQHQRYPFERVVEDQGIEPPPDRCPLFDVVASLDTLHGSLPALKHDVTFLFRGAAGALSLEVTFNARLFGRETIAAFSRSYLRLLDSALENPALPIAALEILPVEDARAILEDRDGTRTAAGDLSVPALFESQADSTPDEVAIVHEGAALTYRELDERANRLARHLQSMGAGPGVLVAICMFPSQELLVGLLGILKSGAAYLPLDPGYPRDRLAFILEDAQPWLVLTHLRARDRLPAARAEPLCLDTNRDRIAEGPSGRLIGPGLDDVAYVIFTSGSTGKPNGVCMPHRALSNLLAWQRRQSKLPAGARTLQRTSIGFDVSVQEIFATWCSGGTLVVAPEELRNDLWRLPQFLAEQRIARAFLPFVALQHLANAMVARQRFPPTLREIVTAGEQLRITQPIMEVFRQLDGCSLVNHYGPTETHVVTSFSLDGPPIRWSALPPIGRPIDNTQIYLLDPTMRLVPVGAVGELYVGGTALSQGYLNRPALTADRFPPNPFDAHPGARLYRTGDLARRRRDGEIEFLGRVDRQLKIHGHRIELGEVEVVLSQHPGVAEAVATARVDDTGDRRLVAYVIWATGHHPSSAELRRFLEDKVPPAMIPSVFVSLPTLPLTSTGKIDHRALPAPDWTRPDIEGAFVEARTPGERVLATIWSEILGIERVGVSDNFLSLGGDSILATQVISKAHQAGISISLRDVFQHQTVAELALVASASQSSVVEEDEPGPVPLTPIQRWLLEQRLPNPSHWNMGVLLETREALDFGALQQALRSLVAHHDALRLSFVRDGSGYQQMTGTTTERTQRAVQFDLSAVPINRQREAIEARTGELQSTLDIAAGPLVVVAWFNLGAARPGRLLITAHHLVMDGVSLRILFADLETAYLQIVRGDPVVLPTRTTSFQRWARLVKEYAQSARARSELDYWTCPSEPPPALPLDYTEGRNIEASARSLDVALDASETRALLQDLPTIRGTPIHDALLAALALALTQWTGAPSVFVDVEGHGREDVVGGLPARTVGWFTSLYPLRLDLGGACSPVDALRAVQAQLELVPNNGVGYGILRYLTDPAVSARLAALPRPEVAFNYLGQFDQLLSNSSLFSLASESAGPLVDPRGDRCHLLYIGGRIALGQLRIELRYSAAVHRLSTVAALADGFLAALRGIIAAPAPDGEPAPFSRATLNPTEVDSIPAAVEEPPGDRE